MTGPKEDPPRPTELRWAFYVQDVQETKNTPLGMSFGGPCRARTDHPRLAKAVLYQMS